MGRLRGHSADLLREVGRRIMAWILNQVEPGSAAALPSRLRFEERHSIGDAGNSAVHGQHCLARWRCGDTSTNRWNGAGVRCTRWNGVSGWRPVSHPALAERIGRWTADHTQRQVLEMLAVDHRVHWSAPHYQVDVNVQCGHDQAPTRLSGRPRRALACTGRASHGRFRPTLAVGRDGIFVPLCHGCGRRGRLPPLGLGPPWQPFWERSTSGRCPSLVRGRSQRSFNTILQDILRRVDSQGLRLVYVTTMAITRVITIIACCSRWPTHVAPGVA